MNEFKRYHPLTILYDFWAFLKNSFFIILLLIFNRNSESTLFIYAKFIFPAIVLIMLVALTLQWFTSKYKLDDEAFYLKSGVFQKREQTIPFLNIQNTQQQTSYFHQLFRVTSITFETGISSTDSTAKFDVISKKEAENFKRIVEQKSATNYVNDEDSLEKETTCQQTSSTTKEVTVHFTPATKDTFKAAFSSFSFLLIIPIIITIFSKLEDLFDIGDKMTVLYSLLTKTWWIIAIIIIFFILLSVSFGILRTFLKYGKYEISSDDELIYIKKGIVSESAFTISKEKVQAIEINQSFLKRLLRLAEVKLISAGNIGDVTSDTNSLYPFLPINKAYALISEVIPSYTVTPTMELLPKKSFWIRIIRPSWVWMIATGALFYFKPSPFNFAIPWWVLSLILLTIIMLMRILEFINTRYVISGKFVQFKTGSLGTTLFITKREKLIEVATRQSILQRKLGLSSIVTVNRSKPVHYSTLKDVPFSIAHDFINWYGNRMEDIEVIEEEPVTEDFEPTEQAP